MPRTSASDAVDQSQLTGATLAGSGGLGDRYRGMGFQVSRNGLLSALSFNINSVGINDLKVYVDTADVNSIPTHSVANALYSFTIPKATLAAAYKKYSLPVPLPVTTGTQYVFYWVPWDIASNTIQVEQRDFLWRNADVYPRGGPVVTGDDEVFVVSDGGALDLKFEVYLATQRQVARDFGTCLNLGLTSTDNIDVPESASLDLAGTYSASVWIFRRSNGSGGNGRIYEKASAYSFLINNANAIAVGNGASTKTSASNVVSNGKWQHLVVTYDGSNVNYYVNAVAISPVAQTVNPTVNSADLFVGNKASLANVFDGLMDDLRIYKDRVLTPTEITNLFYGQEPSPTGLSLQYKFNEGSGTSATDSSGNANTGVITGAIYATNPPLGIATRTVAGNRVEAVANTNSLSFLGGAVSDVVTFADSPSLALTNAITMSCWVDLTSAGPSGFGRFIEKNNCYAMITQSNTVFATVLAGNTFMVTVPSMLGSWKYMTVTYDRTLGSNQINFYINAVNVGSATFTTALNVNSNSLLIGNNVTLIRKLDGLLDEVKIYNRALSASEVLDLYRGAIVGNGLVLHTRFNEGSGTVAIDSSGNQADGVITGAVYSTNVPFNPGSRTVVT